MSRVPGFANNSDLVHAYMQTGKFTLLDLIKMLELFPPNKELPKDYAELLEKTFHQQLRKEPYEI